MSNIEQSIAKLSDPKNDFLQQMQPFDNMASQLGSAPLAINVLGQLCLIATEVDFDLRVDGYNTGFKLLKYPESFRASLCQVSQLGYDAFMEADSCMEKIQLRSAQVSCYFYVSCSPIVSMLFVILLNLQNAKLFDFID